MAVAVDAVGPSSAGTGNTSSTTLTWSHTLTGSNLALLVGVSLGNLTTAATSATVTATAGGTAMTKLGTTTPKGATAEGVVVLFGLAAVAAGTVSVTVTSSVSQTSITGGSVSFSGAASFGTAVTANGTGTSSAVSVTGTATTNMVASMLGAGSPIGATSGVSTSAWLDNFNQSTGAGNGAMATAPSLAGTVTMTRALSSDDWGAIAVEVKAAAASPVTVTDRPGTAEAGGGRDSVTATGPVTASDPRAGTTEAGGGRDTPVAATAPGTTVGDPKPGTAETFGGQDSAVTPDVTKRDTSGGMAEAGSPPARYAYDVTATDAADTPAVYPGSSTYPGATTYPGAGVAPTPGSSTAETGGGADSQGVTVPRDTQGPSEAFGGVDAPQIGVVRTDGAPGAVEAGGGRDATGSSRQDALTGSTEAGGGTDAVGTAVADAYALGQAGSTDPFGTTTTGPNTFPGPGTTPGTGGTVDYGTLHGSGTDEAFGGRDSVGSTRQDAAGGSTEAWSPISGRPHPQDDPTFGAVEAFGNAGDTLTGATAGTLSNLPILRILADFSASPPSIPNNTHGDGNTVEITRDLPVTGMKISRGRQYELGTADAGTADLDVQDPYELLNPANPTSPYNVGTVTASYTALGGATPAGARTSSGSYTSDYVFGYDFTVSGSASQAFLTAFRFYRTDTTITGPISACIFVTGNTTTPVAGTSASFSLSGSGWQTATLASPVLLTPGVSYRMAFTIVGRASFGNGSTSSVRNIGPLSVNTLYCYNNPGGPSPGYPIYNGVSTLSYLIDVVVSATTTATLQSYRPVKVTAVWNRVQYPLFTGFIERYPQTWINAGFRGVKPLECVDALGILANISTHQSYFDTIMADAPAVWIPFNDPSGPGAVYLSSPQALTSAGSSLPGNPRVGTSAFYQMALLVGGTGLRIDEFTLNGGQVSWGSDQMPDGTPALALSSSISNTDTSGAYYYSQGKVKAAGGTFSLDTRGSTVEFWAKLGAGSNRVVVASVTSGRFDYPADPDQWLVLIPNTVNDYFLWMRMGAAASFSVYSTASLDGNWHYYAATFTANNAGTGADCTLTIDNTSYSSIANGVTYPLTRLAINDVTVFSDTNARVQGASSCSVFGLAYYPVALTATQRATHYQRGLCYAGETALTRYSRLRTTYYPGAASATLGYIPDNVDSDSSAGIYGVPGSQNVDTAVTPSSVLEFMQEADLATQGFTWVTRDGIVQNETRNYRAVMGTARYVFGDHPDIGELPYTDIEFDYDPTYVFTQTQISRVQGNQSGGQPVTQINPSGLATFGPRTWSQSVSLYEDFDVFQLGMMILRRYGSQRLRVRKLVLDAGAHPDLVPVVLTLELSTRVTVNRRTAAGVLITGDYFVEHIEHNVEASESKWETTLEVSPVFAAAPAGQVNSAVLGVIGSTATVVY